MKKRTSNKRRLGPVARGTIKEIARGARQLDRPAPVLAAVPAPQPKEPYMPPMIAPPMPFALRPLPKPPPDAEVRATRARPPAERSSITREFHIDALEIGVTVGLYPDGRPCEIFIDADKAGTLAAGALNGAATAASLALQHGAPLASIARQWKGMRFEPAGFTGDAVYPRAFSVLDLIGRWLLDRFCPETP